MKLGTHLQENTWHWEKQGDLAVLYDDFENAVRYNEESIRATLENVNKFKDTYATEEAWRKQMRKISEGVSLFGIKKLYKM